MRVLVCGGRYHNDQEYVDGNLDRLAATRGPFERLIHGGARGVDQMAGKWARKHGILEWAFAPRWHRIDETEGERRNRYMMAAGSPELVIVFPGGRGTMCMVERAKEARVEVMEIAAPSRQEK